MAEHNVFFLGNGNTNSVAEVENRTLNSDQDLESHLLLVDSS